MINVSPSFQLNQNTITQLGDIKPGLYTDALGNEDQESLFETVFREALNNINTTNGYLSQAENEEIKLALGESDNTHDLAIALQKASTALQYTVAVRDKFLEAYKELINMQF